MRGRLSLAVGAVLLAVGTALVFHAFDAHSHSASDTLRPFLITMLPLWVLSVGAARIILRGRA